MITIMLYLFISLLKLPAAPSQEAGLAGASRTAAVVLARDLWFGVEGSGFRIQALGSVI